MISSLYKLHSKPVLCTLIENVQTVHTQQPGCWEATGKGGWEGSWHLAASPTAQGRSALYNYESITEVSLL
jgi:hypothetical protein